MLFVALFLELKFTHFKLAQSISTFELTKPELSSIQAAYSHLQSKINHVSKNISIVEESITSKFWI